MGVKPVVTQLVVHPEKHEYAAGDTDTETKNINERISYMLFKISYDNFQIIFKHDFSPFYETLNVKRKKCGGGWAI